MKLWLWASPFLALLGSVAIARQVTGTGEAAFFDSTSHSDAIRLSMDGVTPALAGKGYVAWLVSDSDTTFTKLGQITVQSNLTISFVYRDNSAKNLLATNKKFLITQESIPFNGTKPTLSSVLFGDSLYGPGLPASTSPLAQIRNCLVGFSNTYQNLGLALVFKIDSNDYVQHAGFARDGAIHDQVGNARLHSDHVYDFIMGHLTGLVSGNTSVVSHTDPVGYGFRRYWELGTHDSSQGGAGYLGGAGFHIELAINDPTATPRMIREGSSALVALRNAFGSQNDSGLAWKVTDRALRIITGNYVTGQLVTEGDPFYHLALDLAHGTAGISDTSSVTGGIAQAYFHIQRMASFALKPASSTSVGANGAPGIPNHSDLHQNYPNPFNPSTDITFDIPHTSRVWITIYNILGQEISRLIDGLDYSPGTYRTGWHGAAASGIYFRRMQTLDIEGNSSTSIVRRMILLR